MRTLEMEIIAHSFEEGEQFFKRLTEGLQSVMPIKVIEEVWIVPGTVIVRSGQRIFGKYDVNTGKRLVPENI